MLPGMQAVPYSPAHPAAAACTASSQGYKAQLTSMGQWDAAMASLSQPAQDKLRAMCQL